MTKHNLTDLNYEELQVEIKRRQKAVRSLHRKRDRILRQLDEVSREIEAAGGKRVRTHGSARRPRNAKTLADAIADALEGRILSVTELAATVQADGYKTTSPNFRTIVNQALLKDDRFRRVSRGKYTLKGSGSRSRNRKR